VINGVGLAGVTSFPLGVVGAYAVMVADGTNWNVVGGQQDTGWVTVSLGTNIGAGPNYSPQSRVVGAQAQLRGSLQNNTGGTVNPGTTVATVQGAAFPARTVNFANFNVDTSGHIVNGGSFLSAAFLLLDSFTYPIAV
jgi:hypothetical protein